MVIGGRLSRYNHLKSLIHYRSNAGGDDAAFYDEKIPVLKSPSEYKGGVVHIDELVNQHTNVVPGAMVSTVDVLYYPGVLEYCLKYRTSYHTLHVYEPSRE